MLSYLAAFGSALRAGLVSKQQVLTLICISSTD
jgi:hypothetical protein